MPAIDFEALFERSPNPYMVLDRQLRYVAVNAAYLRVTASRREDLLGRGLFDAFPHDPLDPANASARQLRASLERVLSTGEPDTIALIAYRVPRHTPEGTVIEERFWSATHTPLLDETGAVAHILQHTVDVTEVEQLRRAQQDNASAQVHAGLLDRAQLVQTANLHLESERSHLRRLFDQAPGFVCILRGPEHVFEIANRAYLQLVGHRPILGRPLREALPELAGQGFFELLERVHATKEAFVGRAMRLAIQRTPGAPIEEAILDFVYQPILGPGGEVTGIFVQGHDITQQARLEAERERLAVLVEQSNEFIGVSGLDARVHFVNEAGLRLVGLSAERMPRLRVHDFFFPEDIAFVEETILPTVARQGRWEGEIRFRHFATGAPIPVTYNVFLVRDPATGEPRGYATVTHDMSAQKRAEAEQAALSRREQAARADADAAERRQRFLAESIPQQVWTAAADGAIEYVSRRALEYTGARAEEMSGSGWLSFVHPDDRRAVGERWREAVRTGETCEMHLRLRRADGAWRWHLTRALPLRDEAGAVLQWIGTNTDVDEERQAQLQVAERAQFEQQLIGIVSHDLRNPLGTIILVAQALLRRSDIDDRTLRAVARIESNAERMTRMIRDLLDFTQARLGGGLKLDVRPANLHQLAEQVVDDVRMVHATRQITFEPQASGEGEWDPDRVTQVLTNLLTNAVKYSPAASPVRVHTRGEAGEVVLEVHNAGEPIPPERLEKLFEPLQRATALIDNSSRSVGLGLYIVDRIVRAHRGEIRVESSADAGTTFTVRLPRSARAQA